MKTSIGSVTLLEVVLVIAIIAILTTMFLPNFQKMQLSSKVAVHNANVRMIKSAAQLYLVDNPNEDGAISNEQLKEYLEEGSDLKPDKDLGLGEEFKVITSKGSVEISPGEVELGPSGVITKKGD